MSSTCVKWGDSWSCVFMVSSGVRQGSVLSPLLFAVYVDDIGKLQNSRVGKFVVLYADDILLLAPSVTVLQELLRACEHELEATDMSINVKKSCCMRIGPRHNKICSEISTVVGRNLAWVGEIRYLGVFIVRVSRWGSSRSADNADCLRSAVFVRHWMWSVVTQRAGRRARRCAGCQAQRCTACCISSQCSLARQTVRV